MRKAIVVLVCMGGLAVFFSATRAQEAGDSGVKVAVASLTETRYKTFGKSRSWVRSRLEVTLHLTGGPAAGAKRYGNLEIDKAVADKGDSLKREERLGTTGLKTIGSFDRMGIKDGFGVKLRLSVPPRQATKLVEVTGSVTLVGGGKEEAVEVKDLAGMVGKTLSDARLEKAGIKIKITKVLPQGVNYQVSGNTETLLDIELADPSGSKVSGSKSSMTTGGIQSVAERTRKPVAGLKVKLLVGAELTKVPIRLKDIPLP